jgi:hypothetical protein
MSEMTTGNGSTDKKPKKPAPEITKVTVQPKKATDWGALLASAAADHWRTLRVTVRVREKLLAGKPAQLDAAKAMLKARGLEDKIEALRITDSNALKLAAAAAGVTDALATPETAQEVAEAASETVDEGLCEFHRREGRPGLWMPANNVKAMLKENWSVLGYRVEHRGSRGAMAEGVFVFGVDAKDKDWIRLSEKSAPDAVEVAVSHTTGPKGPVSSIKRHEYLLRPTVTFDIAMAVLAVHEPKKADAKKSESEGDAETKSKIGRLKIPDDALARTLVHAAEHGLGACRSQGHGRFDIVSVEETGSKSESEIAK